MFQIEPVAPFPGAWIEISTHPRAPLAVIVAPFPGAWIEIRGTRTISPR